MKNWKMEFENCNIGWSQLADAVEGLGHPRIAADFRRLAEMEQGDIAPWAWKKACTAAERYIPAGYTVP